MSLWVVYNIKSNLINSIHETKEKAIDVKKSIENNSFHVVVQFDPEKEKIKNFQVIGKQWIN